MFTKILKFTILFIFLAGYAGADDIVFAKKQLQIISKDGIKHNFNVEIADDPRKQGHGLMFRKSIPENQGMLFLFGTETEMSMWMKNTYIPLDMVFIKHGGIIGKIVAGTTPLSTEHIISEGKVEAVLELNAGTCNKLNIKENDRVVF